MLAGVALLAAATGALGAQESLTEVLAAARRTGGHVIFENDYVRDHNTILEYPEAPRRVAEERPVVLYVRLAGGHDAGHDVGGHADDHEGRQRGQRA